MRAEREESEKEEYSSSTGSPGYLTSFRLLPFRFGASKTSTFMGQRGSAIDGRYSARTSTLRNSELGSQRLRLLYTALLPSVGDVKRAAITFLRAYFPTASGNWSIKANDGTCEMPFKEIRVKIRECSGGIGL